MILGELRGYHELSYEEQKSKIKERLKSYCQKVYKHVKDIQVETRTATVCQREVVLILFFFSSKIKNKIIQR